MNGFGVGKHARTSDIVGNSHELPDSGTYGKYVYLMVPEN
jgi:hypothetical protein